MEMVRKGGGGHHSLGEPSNVRVQCPLCRLHTMSESISYVQQQEEVFLGGNDVQVSLWARSCDRNPVNICVYMYVCMCVCVCG